LKQVSIVLLPCESAQGEAGAVGFPGFVTALSRVIFFLMSIAALRVQTSA
jgi:hypothetical protein